MLPDFLLPFGDLINEASLYYISDVGVINDVGVSSVVHLKIGVGFCN